MALTDNLISYYKLDGNSNDAHGSNNGSDTNIIYSLANGKIGQGAGFNGVNSGISVPHDSSIDITGDKITISAWSKFTTAGYRQIVAMSSGTGDGDRKYGLFFSYSSSQIGIGFETRTTSTVDRQIATSLSTNTWYHIVGVYDGSKMYIYLNGVKIDEVNQSGNIRQLTQPMYIGNFFNGFSFHDGAIDEVAIFDRALSASEISELYNSGNGLTYPFTIANTSNFFQLF